jgi:hypothetical protein
VIGAIPSSYELLAARARRALPRRVGDDFARAATRVGHQVGRRSHQRLVSADQVGFQASRETLAVLDRPSPVGHFVAHSIAAMCPLVVAAIVVCASA